MTRAAWKLAVVAALLCLFTAVPASAWAIDETIAPSYEVQPLTFPDGTSYACPSWSAGTDANGTFYIPCDRYIYRVGAGGSYVGAIKLDDAYRARRDVAVNSDGSVIYYPVSNAIYDHPAPDAPNVGKVIRLVRQLDGSYQRDEAFDIGPFDIGGVNGLWSARNMDVDLAGHLYVSVNAYVFVFDARGNRIAAFGSDDHYVDGQYTEGLEIAQGIAVTPNGNHVYVVEQRRNHVQRWDRTLQGTWVRSSWHIGALGAAGDCSTTNMLASPYDVSLDGQGNIFVLDTSCRRLLKYQAATGAWRATVWQTSDGVGSLYHGMAVNWRGNVVVPEQGRLFAYNQLTTSSTCGPDSDLPVFTRMRSASVVWLPETTIRMSASDRCSGVRRIRFSGDVAGSENRWRTYASDLHVGLAGGASGYRTITATVADAYGRTQVRSIRIFFDRSLRARRTISMTGRSSACVADPMASVTSSGWLLADRCATFTGTVLSSTRSASSVKVQLRIPRRTAQRMYVNATGPVTIWVIGNSSTTVSGRLRRGSTVRVTSALIVNTELRSVSAAPAGEIRS